MAILPILSRLTMTILFSADATPKVVIEADPSGENVAVESARSTAALDRAVAEPGASIEHQRICGRLRVQVALRAAREQIDHQRFGEAIAALEPLLDQADGSGAFLETLESAYRGQIALLLNQRESEMARVLAERLRLLPLSDGSGSAESVPPEIKGKKRPYEARAKLDDATPAARATPVASTAFDQAEQLFQDQRYPEALARYEAAYQQDPHSVQPGRERWGYCLFYVSIQRYNSLIRAEGTSPPKSWDDLEADIRLARRLAPGMTQTDEALAAIARARGNTKAPAATTRFASSQESSRPAVQHQPKSAGGWALAESANFRVFHRMTAAEVERVVAAAEEARGLAYDFWFAGEKVAPWTPKCDLYLYPTAAEYGQATGVGPQSPGHTKVANDNGRIVSRMVVLRTDDANMQSAVLPHEVTHVVLAGRFGRHALPRWADEGMAVLTEPRSKQDSHLANLLQSRRSGSGYNCGDILGMAEYPGGRMLDFYAHSVGICRFLVETGGADKLVQFLRLALEHGNYEAALTSVYGMRFAELEGRFSRYVADLGQGQSLQIAQNR